MSSSRLRVGGWRVLGFRVVCAVNQKVKFALELETSFFAIAIHLPSLDRLFSSPPAAIGYHVKCLPCGDHTLSLSSTTFDLS